MDSNAMFNIKKLECNYENTTVFSAENIEIPRGKITIILGPSGSGKSTFIEALGLMNKTMTDESEVIFYSQKNYKYIKTDGASGIELNSLWKKNKGKFMRMRDEVRYNGYSFVFQDTYLMPNFSAIDNIALTDLIKHTKLADVYHKIIRGLVKSLNLQNLFFKNQPSSYSGGERQRMAFGRGIFPDFEVLFGDEPTGNLDPHNAREVLRYLKGNINRDNCAIIVTHSVELAIEFADKILVLSPKEKVNSKKKFTVLPDFTFYRGENNDWICGEGLTEVQKKKLENFRKKIDFLITSDYGDLVLELSKIQEKLIKDGEENTKGEVISSNEKGNRLKYQKYVLVKYCRKAGELIQKIKIYEKYKEEITKLFSKLEKTRKNEVTDNQFIKDDYLKEAGKLLSKLENGKKLETDIKNIQDNYGEEVNKLLSEIKKSREENITDSENFDGKTKEKAIELLNDLEKVRKNEINKILKINDTFKKEALDLLIDLKNELKDLSKPPEGFYDQEVIQHNDNEKPDNKDLYEEFFEQVMSLSTLIEWNETNEDLLISKVVAEIPNKKIRGQVIESFETGTDPIVIDYKEELKKAKEKERKDKEKVPRKSILRNAYDFIFKLAKPFQSSTLWFFKFLIESELYITKKFRKNLNKLSSDFLDIFIYNELREFLGRFIPKNFIFVLFIQFLIFYLIGTANGILDFVAKQDKNPFVRVINISSSYDGIESKMNDVLKEINLKEYGIDTIAYFKQVSNHFNPVNERPDTISNEDFFGQNNFQIIPISSVQPEDPLRNFILQNRELHPVGTDFSGSDDYSVIVTRNFLKRLGQTDSVFIFRSINNGKVNKCYQPLPVRGLVDQLPGDADMICLDNLWASIVQDNAWQMATDKFILWIKMDSTLLFNDFDSVLSNELQRISQQYGIEINTEDYYDDIFMDTVINKSITNIRDIENLYEYNVTAPQISIQEAQIIYDQLMSSKSVKDYLSANNIPLGRIQVSFIKNLSSATTINYNNANIYIDNFRRIYEFSDQVYQISGLRLDMAKIERIRNYKIVASVTSLLSAFLIIFSILIIIILLSNILSNHLNKIRKNIGLLMAFGVNTKIIYQCIMITFIIVTLLIGAFMSYIVGTELHFNRWLFETTTGFVLPNFSGFQISWAYISDETTLLRIVTNPTLITVALMLFFNLIRFNYIINKIFKETPGNLIYDKSNKA